MSLVSLDAGGSGCHAELHDKFKYQVACSASAGNVSTESIVEIDGLSVSVASVELHGLDANSSFSVACLLRNIDKKRTPPQMYSEVTLSSVGPQPPAPRLGTPVAGVVYITVHFTWACDGHSDAHFMSATTGSTVFLGSASPLIFTNLWLALASFTARRSVPCLALVAMRQKQQGLNMAFSVTLCRSLCRT